jgi:phosphohistidine swiveling domain-containing protein
MIFQQGHLTMVYLAQDWKDVGQSLLSKTLLDSQYIPSVYQAQLELGRALVRQARKVLSENLEALSFEHLVRRLRRLKLMWLEYDRANVLPWHVMADYLGEYLGERLREKNHAVSDEDLLTLMTPASKSFNLQEELACYEVALKAKRHLNARPNGSDSEQWVDQFANLIAELATSFGWIPFGYDGPEVWDAAHYQHRVERLIVKTEPEILGRVHELRGYDSAVAERQNSLRKSLDLSQRIWRLLGDFHTVAEMTNQRKEFSYQSHIAIKTLMKQMAIRLKLDPEDLENLTDDEISRFRGKQQYLHRLAARRRSLPFIFEFTDGKYVEIEGATARSRISEMIPDRQSENTVSGEVASKGNYPSIVGRVRVLNSTGELGEMQPGDVLISSMTTPEFVPAMRMASAVVTDEGGVTCHAAIVSRELGIPCVIGTERATRVFRNGDFVEIDLEHRLVRRITTKEYDRKKSRHSNQPRKVIQSREFNQASFATPDHGPQSGALILDLDEVRRKDFSLVGGKAANLGEIINHFPVPPGFCLTVIAYDWYISHNRLKDPIFKALKSLDVTDLKKLTNVSKQVSGMILSAKLPEQLSDAILTKYLDLRAPVAVRSSGVAEDRVGASFAGQHESVLSITSDESLVDAVKRCWASLFSPRALSYSGFLEGANELMEMGVLIQKMVDADISGVMFTQNPIGVEPEMLIEAYYGLGENVVSGRVTPERYTINRLDAKIKRIQLSPHRNALKGGISEGLSSMNGGVRRSRQILSEEQLEELALLGMKLERHFGCAQDVEWTVKGTEFQIVQSRPALVVTNQNSR